MFYDTFVMHSVIVRNPRIGFQGKNAFIKKQEIKREQALLHGPIKIKN